MLETRTKEKRRMTQKYGVFFFLIFCFSNGSINVAAVSIKKKRVMGAPIN